MRTVDGALGAGAVDGQRDLVADRRQADAVAQIGRAVDRRAIDGDHQIAAAQPGALGRRARQHPGDQRPLGAGGAERPGEIGGQVLDRHPDLAAPDLAVADQLVHHVARHIDRHGKADADIAALRRQDRGVDADQPAAQIDQRAARIAGIDRGVGLDEILVALDAEPGAAERADDPRGHGLAEAERVADGEHEIPDPQMARIAQRHRRQIFRRDLQHGDVGGGIAPDQPRLEAAVVLGGDFDVGGVLDDVVVGQHIALRGIDDDARADRLGLALDRLVAEVEELAEHRVLRQRVVLAHLAACTAMPTTPGVMRLTTSATLVTGAPSLGLGYRRAGLRRMRQRRRQRDPGRYNERRQYPVHSIMPSLRAPRRTPRQPFGFRRPVSNASCERFKGTTVASAAVPAPPGAGARSLQFFAVGREAQPEQGRRRLRRQFRISGRHLEERCVLRPDAAGGAIPNAPSRPFRSCG